MEKSYCNLLGKSFFGRCFSCCKDAGSSAGAGAGAGEGGGSSGGSSGRARGGGGGGRAVVGPAVSERVPAAHTTSGPPKMRKHAIV